MTAEIRSWRISSRGARPDVFVQTSDSLDVRRDITHLPFIVYDYGRKQLPFADGAFDQVLMATVLHHCDDPEAMFDEVVRTAKPEEGVPLRELFLPGDERERALNILFDWYFNAVVHQSDLPCPFAHYCIEQWRYFLESKGLTISEYLDVGRMTSIPLVYVLFVAIKPESPRRCC